ncbi:MAG: DUF29 family protein [Nostoc sp. ChiSLP02]|nr:DUF29 family protein [Nostoc sp. DedSLP05]MDZ8100765.1 DUF29 family protein [Nostoc sp. DedSLP01]MDZ8189605.1 DUF29 family protein [Nostoc sp. ChiSLP02]
MKSIKLQLLQTLYEQDFYAWVEQTAALLESHQWEALDLEHLILDFYPNTNEQP